jgi:alpha,alpha-trehalose phosphorylase
MDRVGRAVMRAYVFAVEPWSVTARQLHPDLLAQTEPIYTLSNGHVGLCGNLDEGEPHSIPGSYMNGFFKTLPLPYAEVGYDTES